VGLEESIYQAKTPVCAYSFAILKPHTDISIFTQMMLQSDIMGERAFDIAVEAPTVASCAKVLEKIRAAITARRYMAFQGGPNVNDQLVTVINNIGDQLRHSQTAYTAANPTDQTDIAAFWAEWVRDMIPYLLGHGGTWAQNAITEARKNWRTRTDGHIQQALNDLASLQAELQVAVNVDLTNVR
jgi:hypothetical protein